MSRVGPVDPTRHILPEHEKNEERRRREEHRQENVKEKKRLK
jgi:hypothetical protein